LRVWDFFPILLFTAFKTLAESELTIIEMFSENFMPKERR
jgi:hypothetical protein